MSWGYQGGGGSGGPRAQSAMVPTSAGVVRTLSRMLGSTSTFSLIAGTNANLTLTGANQITAAVGIAAGVSQVAVVREVNGQRAAEYPLTLTGAVLAPVNTVAPALSASAAYVGQALTASTGAWSNSPSSYSYQWFWADTVTPISGATSASYTPVTGDLGHTLACNVTATNAGGSTTVSSNVSAAVETAPALTYPVITKVVTEGDSITSSGGGYMATAIAANPGVTFTNVAVAGSGMGGPADDSSGNSTVWGRIHLVVAAAPQLVTILIGANGVFPMSNLTSYITALKTRLPGVLVAVSTILPATTHGASRETLRLARNAEIRAALGTSIDAVIPMGDHPVASLYANGATYFPDGLHPSTVAHTAYAAQYDAVVSGIIARLNDSTPDVFTFTDTNNVPASTTATALTLVRGMGRQASATASVTGAGDFANGLGAYSTAAKTVINGDVLISRVTASAAPSTPLDQVLTIGGVSDTWTVTSASPANVGFTAAATHKIYTGGVDYGTKTRTVTGVEIPAGRPVIAMYHNNTGISAMVIDGVAMTKIVQSGTWSMWAANTEMAAGSYDLAITSGDLVEYRIFSGSLTATSSPTPGSVSKSTFQFRNPWEIISGDVSLTIGTGGLGLIFCAHPGQPFYTLNDAVVGQGYDNNYHWLTMTTSRIPQLNFSGGTAAGNGLLAAAWP